MADSIKLSGNDIRISNKRATVPAKVGVDLPAMQKNQPGAAAQVKAATPASLNEAPRKMARMSATDLSKFLSKMRIYTDQFQIQAKYSINLDTGDNFVEIVDKSSGQVIRRIPPYEAIEIVGNLKELAGMLLDQKV